MSKQIATNKTDVLTDKPLFNLDDLADGGSIPAARKRLASLLAAGAIKRFAYGLYYVPGNSTDSGALSSLAIEKTYVGAPDNAFGFYGGPSYLQFLLKNTPTESVIVYSNKATSGKKTIYRFSKRFTVKKPYLEVTKDNATLNAFLTYIATTPLDEVKGNSFLLANYIREQHFAAPDVLSVLSSFPSKVADKLLQSELYKCLWKH